MADIIDLLLNADNGSFKLPEKEVKHNRLSDQLGSDVIFTIRALSLTRLEEIKQQAAEDDAELYARVVAEGIVTPDLGRLKEKFGVLKKTDVVKKLLLAGEITRLYMIISELSGYGQGTLEDIKKK